MKRKTITLILMLIGVLSVLMLSACSDSGGARDSKATEVLNKNRLGMVEIITDVSGRVVSLKFDEYFLPQQFAKRTNYKESLFSDQDVTKVIVANGDEVEYISVFDIDGENFIINLAEYKDTDGKSFSPKRYTVDYKSYSKESVNTYIATEDGSQKYIEGLQKGLVTVGKMVNDKYQEIAYPNYYGAISMSCVDLSKIGETDWANEIQKLTAFLVELLNQTKIEISENTINQLKEESKSKFDNFQEYLILVKKAYEQLSQEGHSKELI